MISLDARARSRTWTNCSDRRLRRLFGYLHGHTEDDSLWVPPGFTGNTLDGGFHISTDTCGDCGFSTCSNCTP